MNVLHELLRLKRHREGKAELAVASGRSALHEADQQYEQAQGELHHYRHWSVEHERGLYAAVCQRVVRVRELEWLREDVVMLRQKERDLETELVEREKRRLAAEQHLRQVREQHREASRATEKFLRLVEVQSEEVRLENERKEDVEMEDLYAIRKEREDWGASDDE